MEPAEAGRPRLDSPRGRGFGRPFMAPKPVVLKLSGTGRRALDDWALGWSGAGAGACRLPCECAFFRAAPLWLGDQVGDRSGSRELL